MKRRIRKVKRGGVQKLSTIAGTFSKSPVLAERAHAVAPVRKKAWKIAYTQASGP